MSDTSGSKEKTAVNALDYDHLGTDNLNDLREPLAKNWQIAGNVYMNRLAVSQVTPQEGILLSLPSGGRNENIITKPEHADIDLQLEFMMAAGSHAGIYVQGRYGNSAGASWLFIDDKEVVSNELNNDFNTPYFNKTNLKSGAHSFRCIYNNQNESLVVKYEGPGIPFTILTTPSSERAMEFTPPLEYTLQQEPAYQRGFFMHHGKIDPYTMSVGMPGGLNYAYDLSAWRGKYIDVSNMWTDRGETQREVPLGGLVEFAGKPPLTELSKAEDTWPYTVVVDTNMYTNRTYKIEDNGMPLFLYSYKSMSVTDYIAPLPDRSGLVRKVSVTKHDPNVYWLPASGRLIEKLPDGAYAIDDKEYYIESISIQGTAEDKELMVPYAAGMRSPAGYGTNADGDVFYAENQGDWISSGRITHIEDGDFGGHPASLNWSGEAISPLKALTRSMFPDSIGSLHEFSKKIPHFKEPSIIFPHTLMGISTSGFVPITNDGFAPFKGQMLVGDQGHSKVMRAFLEKVNGKYQGACC